MSLNLVLRQLVNEIEAPHGIPSPRCPECGLGTVAFAEPTQFVTSEMRQARRHEAWEPEWDNGTFLAQGMCGAAGCQQVVIATGTWRVGYRTSGGYAESYSDQFSTFYRVKQVHPPLRVLELPTDPAADVALAGVADGLLAAGTALFTAPGLAATALRSCIERFMSNEGIAQKTVKGTFRPVGLRLQEWRDLDPIRGEVADLMLAVKWLGNTGTHEDSKLTAPDVLDGLELLGEAFHRLYVSPAISATAAAINAAKGPIGAATS